MRGSTSPRGSMLRGTRQGAPYLHGIRQPDGQSDHEVQEADDGVGAPLGELRGHATVRDVAVRYVAHHASEHEAEEDDDPSLSLKT